MGSRRSSSSASWRLAGELHHIQAHCLSGLFFRLESERLLVRAKVADTSLVDQNTRTQEVARNGMPNAGRALQALRRDDVLGLVRLPHPVSDTAPALRLPITLRVEGAPYPPAPEALLTAYRAAREAFTNVAKRAIRRTGALVLLTWALRSPGVPVAASGGDGRGAALVSGGYGLASMERGVLYGRQREAGLSKDGLIARPRVPIDLGSRTERS